jgi:hypothetical protein
LANARNLAVPYSAGRREAGHRRRWRLAPALRHQHLEQQTQGSLAATPCRSPTVFRCAWSFRACMATKTPSMSSASSSLLSPSRVIGRTTATPTTRKYRPQRFARANTESPANERSLQGTSRGGQRRRHCERIMIESSKITHADVQSSAQSSETTKPTVATAGDSDHAAAGIAVVRAALKRFESVPLSMTTSPMPWPGAGSSRKRKIPSSNTSSI